MANCPLLRRKPDKLKRKKAKCATRNGLEKNGFEEDSNAEDATVCFVKDNDDEGRDIEVNDSNLFCDELFCTFEEIIKICRSY